MATLKEDKSHEMGLHEEQLKGRTQQRFFSVDESENLTYFHSFDVDTSKSASIDALDMTPREINREIRELMKKVLETSRLIILCQDMALVLVS